jgi:hypothetical protein
MANDLFPHKSPPKLKKKKIIKIENKAYPLKSSPLIKFHNTKKKKIKQEV